MLTIEATGLKEARETLSKLVSERRLNAITATALTRTAVAVKAAVLQEMTRVFDRPTPYTMRSLYIQTATGSQANAGRSLMPTGDYWGTTKLVQSNFLEARVWFKDESAVSSGTPATQYLLPQVHGGIRRAKAMEALLRKAGILPKGWRVTPARAARRDPYGNASAGQVIQVLSQLRLLESTSGRNANMSTDKAKAMRAQEKAGGRFFVMPVGGKAQPGIYQREYYFNRNITPVFLFVRQPVYRPRLDFFGISRRVVEQRLVPEFNRAVADSLARMRGNR